MNHTLRYFFFAALFLMIKSEVSAQYSENFNSVGCMTVPACFTLPSGAGNLTGTNPIEGTCSVLLGPLTSVQTMSTPGLYYAGSGSVQIQFRYQFTTALPAPAQATLTIKLLNLNTNAVTTFCTTNTAIDVFDAALRSCSNTPPSAGDYKVIFEFSGTNNPATNILVDQVSVSNMIQNQGANGASCNSLPVVLTKFEAKPDQCTVKINWSTAEEVNADYFELQRSASGAEYAEIARIFTNVTHVNGGNYS
jgi:hypothetical protein